MSKQECNKCEQSKKISEFREDTRSHTKRTHHTICKKCESKTDAARKAEKKAFINKHKAFCAKCGEERNHVLTFHHRDPEDKTFKISGVNASKKRIVTEILKCVVLCHNCHVEFHHFERLYNITTKQYIDKDFKVEDYATR